MSGLEPLMLALAVGGQIASAVGQFQATKAQAAGKKFEAQVAERNAKVARSQAQIDAEDARRDVRRRLATIRAAYGSKGFSLSGSPLDILEDQAAEGELSAQREAHAGELIAIGQTDKARAARVEAKALRSSALPGLIGGLAGTAGRTAIAGFDLGVFG